jgi:hypothetical protein
MQLWSSRNGPFHSLRIGPGEYVRRNQRSFWRKEVGFDGSNIWVANHAGNSVTKLLASTGAVVRTYGLEGAYAVAFDGTDIWVANEGDNSVTKISATR